ncbi:MAG: SoxY-related AACIE arm protein [Betaproteobacteria bacterium]|nr:SoxY-related AACIE arm protein [Betaproteobacteria bacterium]NBY06376.1 SoxY-related AACIE arm protein [Betaproteobacteria bacterium]
MTIQRRDCLTWLSALGLAPHSIAFASPDQAKLAIQTLVGDKIVQTGRVILDIPPLIENGNSVVMTLQVESPMTQQDYVKSVHVLAEGNPLPHILSAYFTPRSGRAQVMSRVRLAENQRVWAIAQMSNGSFWRGYADTLVTTSACTEER